MTGALGKLDEIVALKKKHKFRILIDDAHGFGLLGEHGRGTSEHFGVMDGIDLYIGAFAKSMASIGGFVAGPHSIINYLRANMRSQMYAKSLPMAFVIGNLKRMEIIDSPEGDELRKKCWAITHAIPKGMIIFRIVSTAAHTMEDVEYTLKAFKEIKAKLDAGLYDGDDIAAMTVK